MKSVSAIAQKQTDMDADMKEIKADVKALNGRPARRWENVVEKARLAVELAGTGFGEEEREVFYRVLAIIAGNLHKLCRDGLNQNITERI